MSYLELKNICFKYEEGQILRDFSLSLEEGEFHSLLGQSGCGKSTILHLIAGFLEPQKGTIAVNGQSLLGIPPEKRKMGIVFQEHCLFPHMTVEDNIKYGSEDGNVDEFMELIRLEDKRKKYPDELSGGEQQRVAIARTLAIRPKLLLLDEPFSSLDQNLREELEVEIKEITTKLNLTTLLVTHSMEEAVEMSDRITLLKKDGGFQTGHYKDIPEVFNYLSAQHDKIHDFL